MIAVRPRLAQGVTRSELSDNEFVVSRRGGDKALIVNAVGDAVLDLCDGSRTVEEIATFLRETLRVPDDVDVATDVRAVIDELARAGVIASE